MANTVGSPFASSGTAQRLPDRKLSREAKLTIRLDSPGGGSDRVLIRNHPTELVDAAHADLFLLNGESVSFESDAIINMQDISIIASAGTGNVYWGVT